MAIAIGSLVDDAIIDVENVYKRLRENYARPKAEREKCLKVVYDASREIRVSIVNATFITIVAFVPLFLLGGMEGRMLKPLGIAFIISLLASLLVAVTLTPVMSSYMLTSERALKRSQKEPPVTRFFKRIYGKALTWTLGHRKTVLTGVVTLFVGAAIVFSTFGSSFLPPFNEGSLTISVATMPGVSLEESDRMGRMVEEILLEIPEIQTVARKTGRAELDEHALGVNASELEAPFVLDRRSRDEFLADVRHRLGDLKGLTVEVGQPISHRIDAMLSGTKANIAIKLFGEDLNRMYALATQIGRSIAGVEGIADISVEQQVERAQLKITPRREMLALYGVTMPQFNEYITTALAGQAVSQVYEGNNTFDLTVKVADDRRNTIEKIGNLLIDGNGAKIPLSYIADIESSSGPNTVSRENVKRKIVVSANVVGGDLGGAVEAIRQAVDGTSSFRKDITWSTADSSRASSRPRARSLRITARHPRSLHAPVPGVQERPALHHDNGKPALCARGRRSQHLDNLGCREHPLHHRIHLALRHLGTQRHPARIALQPAPCGGVYAVRRGRTRFARPPHPHPDDLAHHGPRLIPLAVNGDVSGNEIQSPMAQVILGGLVSSTLLNGFVMPIMYILVTTRTEKRKLRRTGGELLTDKCSQNE